MFKKLFFIVTIISISALASCSDKYEQETIEMKNEIELLKEEILVLKIKNNELRNDLDLVLYDLYYVEDTTEKELTIEDLY